MVRSTYDIYREKVQKVRKLKEWKWIHKRVIQGEVDIKMSSFKRESMSIKSSSSQLTGSSLLFTDKLDEACSTKIYHKNVQQHYHITYS